MGRVKKLTAIILILIVVISALNACMSEEPINELNQAEVLTLDVSIKRLESNVWTEEKFKLNSKDFNSLYLAYGEIDELTIESVVTSSKGNIPVMQLEKNLNHGKILPGEYQYVREYQGFAPFTVHVLISDYRPELTVVLNGGEDCYSEQIDYPYPDKYRGFFENNKYSRFLYQYNHYFNAPSITLSFEGKTIYTVTSEDFLKYVTTLRVKEFEYEYYFEKGALSDIGYSICDVEIDSRIFEGEYKNKFKKVRLSIHIEIRDNPKLYNQAIFSGIKEIEI